MAEVIKAEATVEKAPEVTPEVKPEVKLEKVILTTQFETNGITYGEPEREDEEGALVLTEVEVPDYIAVDLRRRQREYDRVERERFQSRKFTVNGRTGRLDMDRS